MTERQYKVAVVGATGVVGREMLTVLEERGFLNPGDEGAVPWVRQEIETCDTARAALETGRGE